MITIAANDVKRHGISVFSDSRESLITVHGKPKFVVMGFADYERLREMELMAALYETQQDLADGNCEILTPEEHVKRVSE